MSEKMQPGCRKELELKIMSQGPRCVLSISPLFFFLAGIFSNEMCFSCIYWSTVDLQYLLISGVPHSDLAFLQITLRHESLRDSGYGPCAAQGPPSTSTAAALSTAWLTRQCLVLSSLLFVTSLLRIQFKLCLESLHFNFNSQGKDFNLGQVQSAAPSSRAWVGLGLLHDYSVWNESSLLVTSRCAVRQERLELGLMSLAVFY